MISVKQSSPTLYSASEKLTAESQRMSGNQRETEELGGGTRVGQRVGQDSNVRRSHAVAIRVLHQVHGLIGKMQKPFFSTRIDWIRGHPNTGCNANLKAGFIQ